MICKCGYEAASVTQAEARLPDDHTLSEHTYYIWGQVDKLVMILDENHLVPKESMGRIINLIEGKDNGKDK